MAAFSRNRLACCSDSFASRWEYSLSLTRRVWANSSRRLARSCDVRTSVTSISNLHCGQVIVSVIAQPRKGECFLQIREQHALWYKLSAMLQSAAKRVGPTLGHGDDARL